MGVWGEPQNQCNDAAGVVEAVGKDVTEFRKGDRVAAYLDNYGGGYAEYALAAAHTTFILPAHTTFQEGAAIGLAALTAVVGLYANDRLNLPQPSAPATEPVPLVIYGGSSAVGSYAIQLAKRSNLHPIIAIAGKASDFVKGMLDQSKGDVVIDYRKGDDAVKLGIRDALKGHTLQHAFDATAGQNSWQNISDVLDHQTGKITLVLPPMEDMKILEGRHEGIPESVHASLTVVGDVHGSMRDLGFLYSKYFALGLQEGWFAAHPQEVVSNGLEGIETGLKALKNGRASAVKYVYNIADTPGIGSSG
ncbi:GroES-like protein [Hortaea werneckii]|uniref:Enoyl reductase (ER) domain-containing protein n=1 Tax=Hortaea werneckii TaxID=91943 RepID=A0A3M7FRT8_HORWE|nr:GroES-like protein [Hortaea werneckii]RMY91568.1 hypothetical protein D0861_03002 [Hortaea werneckii]